MVYHWNPYQMYGVPLESQLPEPPPARQIHNPNRMCMIFLMHKSETRKRGKKQRKAQPKEQRRPDQDNSDDHVTTQRPCYAARRRPASCDHCRKFDDLLFERVCFLVSLRALYFSRFRYELYIEGKTHLVACT